MKSCKAKLFEKFFRIRTMNSGKTMELTKRRFKSQSTFAIPKSFYKIANVKLEKFNSHQCYVITPKNNPSINKCMYIHGGGFISQIVIFQWLLIKRLMLATNATFYVPNYPLSTDKYASAPDVVTMLLEAYKSMLKETKSSNIHIMGDSAGAGLTLILGQQAKLHGLPPPKNLISFSPPLDLDISEAQANEMVKHDAILGAGLLTAACKWYVPAGDDPKKPIYSCLYGDFKDIGFITVFIGEHECLLEQNNELDKKLTNEHIEHNYIVGKEMFHVWVIFRIKESQEPFELIVKLING